MAAPLSEIVDVSITRQAQGISRAGFGVMLILGTEAEFAGRVRSYSSIEGVAEDFETTDAEYKAAQAAFSQTPKPRTIKIGRRETPVAQEQTLTFDVDFVAGNTITLDVDGVEVSVPFNADHSTTLSDLAAAIQAEAGVVTAVVTGAREITITAQTAGVPVTLDDVLVAGGAQQAVGVVAVTVENVGVQEDLLAVIEEDKDWYALVLTDRTQAVVELAAAFIETQRRIFVTASDDADVYDDAVTTDVASVLSDANYSRTAVVYDDDDQDFIDAAWLGRMLPTDPGSATWKFKTLAGISSHSLTTNERNNALAKNANLYTEFADADMMEEGVMANGEFIDLIRGIDWLQARLEENIFLMLKTEDKVPYTNGGIAAVEAQIRAVLENAVRQGVITRDPDKFEGQPYSVVTPDVSAIDPVDRANRLLPDVTFEATPAGAIHKAVITGAVSI